MSNFGIWVLQQFVTTWKVSRIFFLIITPPYCTASLVVWCHMGFAYSARKNIGIFLILMNIRWRGGEKVKRVHRWLFNYIRLSPHPINEYSLKSVSIHFRSESYFNLRNCLVNTWIFHVWGYFYFNDWFRPTTRLSDRAGGGRGWVG